MASELMDFEDNESLLEPQRPSLLDIIEDRNRAASKVEIILRAEYRCVLGMLLRSNSKHAHVIDFSTVLISSSVGDFRNLDREIQRLVQSHMDSEVFAGIPSLLDYKLDRRCTGKNKKSSLLHRIVIISQIRHQNFQDIGQFYDKFFKDLQGQYSCEPATGLLLLYPKHCVHVIEAGPEILLELACLVRNDEESGMGHMEKSKILIISHDIPQRLYQIWAFRVLDIQAPRLEDYDSSEDVQKLVLDTLTQLLKLGAYLARQPKVALKNVMDALHGKVPELLPQQAVIGHLLECEPEEVACIINPAVFAAQYGTPYDVTLQSDLIWPMPVRLFPYN